MVAGGIHHCGRHGCACCICSLLLEDQAPARWTGPPCAGAGGPSAAASGPGAAGVAASPKQTSVSQGGAFQQGPADPGSPRCVRCVCVALLRRPSSSRSAQQQQTVETNEPSLRARGSVAITELTDLPLILPNVRLVPVPELCRRLSTLCVFGVVSLERR